MVATDSGGRGLDWPEVEHVVNFQMPTSAVDWLHRVGRTGRIGQRGLVTTFVANKDKALTELIQARLAAGKDLHGAFSRRRSLPRRLKADGKDADISSYAEDGTHRLVGGIEVFEAGGEAPSANSEAPASGKGGPAAAEDTGDGTVIGYLTTYDDEFDADQKPQPRSKRQAARQAAAAPPGAQRGTEDSGDASLNELRKNLLASDSESDGDSGSDSGSDGEDAATGRRPGPGATAGEDFSWASLDDGASGGAAVGPKPTRQLLNRGGQKNEPPDARRYAQADKVAGRGSTRKGLGVRSSNRVAAGNNYASAEDDLLL